MNSYFCDFKSIVQDEKDDEIVSWALNILGQFYSYGIGINLDCYEAKKYYEMALVKGNMFAAYNLGIYYWGVRDYEKGIWYFLQASKNFIKLSIEKLKEIVCLSYELLTPKNKARILDLSVELADDDIKAGRHIKKILISENLK